MLDASEELFLLSKSPLTASRAPRRDRPLIDDPAPEEALTAPATVEDLLRLHDGGADATDDPTGIWTTLDAMDVTKSAVAMSDPAWQKVADKVPENIFGGEAEEYCEQRVFADILDTHMAVALAKAPRSMCKC